MRLRVPVAAAACLYAALAVVVTWPQARVLAHGVSDFGDPLHFSWTLAWIAHAIVTSPRHLFDANVHFPARWTLAYSETLLLPGVVLAPLMWIGADPILANNLLLLAGYTLSGVTMFVLVRGLAADDLAALVAGAIFAVYPYRIEEYAKVQLQLAFWLPLALWALHRTLEAPRRRRGVFVGLLLVAQIYTCLTYAIYGAVLLAVIGLASLARVPAATRGRALTALVLAVVVAALGAAPLLLVYRAASQVVGERSIESLDIYSAVPNDYRRAHPDNALYGDDGHPGSPERRLFPGVATPALALAAFVPPINVAVGSYLVGALVAADLSLGVNGPGYRWLYEHVAPFRGLRVPARFGMIVGLALAVLAGIGVARLNRGRTAARRCVLACVLLAIVVAEARMRPIAFMTLPERNPAVYRWLAAQPPAVVCEYPVGNLEGRAGPQDETYMYYSTQHWQRLVNGDTGFSPPAYGELLEHLRDFPDDESIGYLRGRGVTLLLVHSAFYITGDFNADVRSLHARPDLEPVAAFRWTTGEVTEVFRVK